MFQRQLRDAVVFIQVAYQSGETDHGAGLAIILLAQPFEFCTRIKIICLYTNHLLTTGNWRKPGDLVTICDSGINLHDFLVNRNMQAAVGEGVFP